MATFVVFNLFWAMEVGDVHSAEPGLAEASMYLFCLAASVSWGFVFLGTLSAPSHQLIVAVALALLSILASCAGGAMALFGAFADVGALATVIMTTASLIGAAVGAVSSHFFRKSFSQE